MSALYRVNYQGTAGLGAAVLYIGHDTVIGAGIGMFDARYQGAVQTTSQGMAGKITLSVLPGTPMVTGPISPATTQYEVTLSWPADWATPGKALAVTVVGMGPVSLTLDKIGDIPTGTPGGFNFSGPNTSGGVLPP